MFETKECNKNLQEAALAAEESQWEKKMAALRPVRTFI